MLDPFGGRRNSVRRFHAIQRRRFILSSAVSTLLGGSFSAPQTIQGAEPDSTGDRPRGLLLGGLIGDALGGPFEFSEASTDQLNLVGARAWSDDRKINDRDLLELASTVPLLGYEDLRPDTSPYGPWRSKAPAGTLTDDSRHKVVLIGAIARAAKQDRPLVAEDIAQAFLDFKPVVTPEDQDAIMALDEEGFREYRYAARWLLGQRDLKQARPVERLWAGISNCSGQMLLPPLAIAYPGDPLAAYKKAFEVDFIDAPGARDIAASIVAGLAAVLNSELDGADPSRRWKTLLTAMRETDPFDFARVPFAGRPLHNWLDKAGELVQRAEGRPKRLYRLLETEGKPVYWWDAHFTLLVPICMLKFCDFNPMAAMHLILDFGHDTDSYAQVLGCMAGAVEGQGVFPVAMADAVVKTLRSDYGEEIDQWMDLLLG